MYYKDKFNEEVIQAVQMKDNVKSIKEVLKFIGKDIPGNKDLWTSAFATYLGILSIEGIKVAPHMVAHMGEWIIKSHCGNLHVVPDEVFKEHFKPVDDIGNIKVQLSLDTTEYDALLEEARQTADKLNSMLRKLKNYRVDTIQTNDRLHCTCMLKPGE